MVESIWSAGKFATLEGHWKPTRLVILRLPDIAAAEVLFRDPEYQPLKALKNRVSNADIVAIEGT